MDWLGLLALLVPVGLARPTALLVRLDWLGLLDLVSFATRDLLGLLALLVRLDWLGQLEPTRPSWPYSSQLDLLAVRP